MIVTVMLMALAFMVGVIFGLSIPRTPTHVEQEKDGADKEKLEWWQTGEAPPEWTPDDY